ncbi:unnamed protein product [Polarella glacialis]|uniref:BTB domain-containing protein n=1 Tax=Polarella glacialis TaxID=89957 RepID=A0A813JE88_POLGL|nr:unnamed protein product [Polarella glacialis]
MALPGRRMRIATRLDEISRSMAATEASALRELLLIPFASVNESASKKRKQGSLLQERAQHLWEKREFTDAIVTCEGSSFPVHRAVLASASPVLQRAFAGGMSEAASAEYAIRDSSQVPVEALLRFCYTGSLSCPAEGLPQLLELAVLFEMAALSEAAVDALFEGLVSENMRERGQLLKRHGGYPAVQYALRESLCNPLASVDESASKKRKQACLLEERAQHLWEKREFTDATVTCEGSSFPVHRAVLASASPVFQRAFAGGMSEAASARYAIRDSNPVPVEALLRFCYTGSLSCPAEGLPQLLELAVLYEVAALSEAVADALLEGLLPKNVRDRGQLLKRHGGHPGVQAVWPRFLYLVAADHLLAAAW